jgi:hypothetical protein
VVARTEAKRSQEAVAVTQMRAEGAWTRVSAVVVVRSGWVTDVFGR